MNRYNRAQLESAIRACEEMEAGVALDAEISRILYGDLYIRRTYTSYPYDLTDAMGLMPEYYDADIRIVCDERGSRHTEAFCHWFINDEPHSVYAATESPSHALTLAALRAQLSLIEE